MSASTFASPQLSPRRQALRRPSKRDVGRVVPTARLTGRGSRRRGPLANPAHRAEGLPLRARSAVGTRGCGDLGPTSGSVATGGLRLTDRGIAAVLVAGAMIVLAAVTVIALTAVAVTGEPHQQVSVSQSLAH